MILHQNTLPIVYYHRQCRKAACLSCIDLGKCSQSYNGDCKNVFSTEEREDFNDNKDDDKQDDNDFVYEDDDHLSSHDQ